MQKSKNSGCLLYKNDDFHLKLPDISSLYTIKENPLTLCSMFSEQTAPIGSYDIPIDSEFHADGHME